MLVQGGTAWPTNTPSIRQPHSPLYAGGRWPTNLPSCMCGWWGREHEHQGRGGDTHTQVVTGRTGNSQGQSQGQNGTRFALRTGLLRVHTHTHTHCTGTSAAMAFSDHTMRFSIAHSYGALYAERGQTDNAGDAMGIDKGWIDE